MNRNWLIAVVQQFFLTHFLREKLSIEPILTFGELQVLDIIRSLPPIPIQPPTAVNPIVYRHFHECSFVQDMLPEIKPSRHDTIQVVVDLVAPDFSTVPMKEVALLREKDKIAPLSTLAVELSKKGENATGIAHAFMDAVWDMAKTLQITKKDVAVGLLGAVPFPFVNPVGLFGAAATCNKYAAFNKNYKWYLSVSAIREAADRWGRKP